MYPPYFWHSGSSPRDVNGDGVDDFVASAFDHIVQWSGTVLFLSNNNGHRPIPVYGASYNIGTSALIKLANGAFAVLAMPYGDHELYERSGATISILKNETLGRVRRIEARQCGEVTTPRLSGYSSLIVADVNNDGLEDFFGLQERGDGQNGRQIFLNLFIQMENSTFYCANKEFGLDTLPYSPFSAEPLPNGHFLTGVEFAVGDLNGDGNEDIAIEKHHATVSSIGYGNFVFDEGSGFQSVNLESQFELHSKERRWDRQLYVSPVSDLNHDGIMDFFVINYAYDYRGEYQFFALVSEKR